MRRHVGEIHLGQGDGDVHGGERHEDPQELIPEGVGVLVLEGVEEVAREEVEAHGERHLGEVDADQHGQEHGADAALGGAHRAEQGNAYQAVGARLEIAVGDGHDGPDHRHEGEPVDEGREGAGADRSGDGRHVAGERLRHEAGSGDEQDGEQQHVGRRQHADEHAQEAGDAPREVDDRRRREGDDRQKNRHLAPIDAHRKHDEPRGQRRRAENDHWVLRPVRLEGMMPKSGHPFSETIMLNSLGPIALRVSVESTKTHRDRGE